MLAVDTNVLVRLITNDDPTQSARARAVFDTNEIWIATTVLLETEWVLRGRDRYTPAQIVAVLRRLAGLPGVSVQDAAITAVAFDWCEQGMDFADALHLAAGSGCDAFVTFDRGFINVARKAGLVREP